MRAIDGQRTTRRGPESIQVVELQLVSPHVQLLPGDTLRTEYTYNNTTGAAVRFGESSNDEMCFTDLFYYPRQGADYVCSGT